MTSAECLAREPTFQLMMESWCRGLLTTLVENRGASTRVRHSHVSPCDTLLAEDSLDSNLSSLDIGKTLLALLRRDLGSRTASPGPIEEGALAVALGALVDIVIREVFADFDGVVEGQLAGFRWTVLAPEFFAAIADLGIGLHDLWQGVSVRGKGAKAQLTCRGAMDTQVRLDLVAKLPFGVAGRDGHVLADGTCEVDAFLLDGLRHAGFWSPEQVVFDEELFSVLAGGFWSVSRFWPSARGAAAAPVLIPEQEVQVQGFTTAFRAFPPGLLFIFQPCDRDWGAEPVRGGGKPAGERRSLQGILPRGGGIWVEPERIGGGGGG